MRAEIRQGDRSSSSEMGKRTWAQEKNHLERKGPPSKFAKGEGGLRNEMDKAHSFEQTVPAYQHELHCDLEQVSSLSFSFMTRK